MGKIACGDFATRDFRLKRYGPVGQLTGPFSSGRKRRDCDFTRFGAGEGRRARLARLS